MRSFVFLRSSRIDSLCIFRFNKKAILLVSVVFLLGSFTWKLVFGIVVIPRLQTIDISEDETRLVLRRDVVAMKKAALQLSLELLAILLAILGTFVLIRHIKTRYAPVSAPTAWAPFPSFFILEQKKQICNRFHRQKRSPWRITKRQREMFSTRNDMEKKRRILLPITRRRFNGKQSKMSDKRFSLPSFHRICLCAVRRNIGFRRCRSNLFDRFLRFSPPRSLHYSCNFLHDSSVGTFLRRLVDDWERRAGDLGDFGHLRHLVNMFTGLRSFESIRRVCLGSRKAPLCTSRVSFWALFSFSSRSLDCLATGDFRRAIPLSTIYSSEERIRSAISKFRSNCSSFSWPLWRHSALADTSKRNTHPSPLNRLNFLSFFSKTKTKQNLQLSFDQ